MKRIDLTGKRFGRLMAREVASAERGVVRWLCVCDCGGTALVSTTHLRSGRSTSCGCVAREKTAQRNKDGAKHGAWQSPEYQAWLSMRKRCNLRSNHAYARYGGAGITVCDEWQNSFEAFFAHVGPRPSPVHSLDRIRNSEGYKPGNVRWATLEEQNNNRKSNVTAEIDGSVLTAAQIAHRYGLSHRCVLYRIRAGKSSAEIVAPSSRRQAPRWWKASWPGSASRGLVWQK